MTVAGHVRPVGRVGEAGVRFLRRAAAAIGDRAWATAALIGRPVVTAVRSMKTSLAAGLRAARRTALRPWQATRAATARARRHIAATRRRCALPLRTATAHILAQARGVRHAIRAAARRRPSRPT